MLMAPSEFKKVEIVNHGELRSEACVSVLDLVQQIDLFSSKKDTMAAFDLG